MTAELQDTASRNEWPPHGNGPVLKTSAKGVESFDVKTDSNFHLPMVQDFVDSLLAGRKPLCRLESAVETALATDAIFRSICSGRCERIEQLPED
jgi:hypothetical protein